MTWHDAHTERERHAALAEGRTAIATQLEELRNRYTNRRSVGWQFVDETLKLVDQRFEELELAYVSTWEAMSEATRKAHRDEVVRLEKSRDGWKDLYQSANERLDERHTIRQELEQAAGADDSKVTISNGYLGWTVAGLEEIAYRLRTGGAEDETPVEVNGSRAVAMVPAPNLVQLDASPKAKSGLADLQDQLPEPGPGRVHVDWRLAAGLLLVVLSIVIGTVVL